MQDDPTSHRGIDEAIADFWERVDDTQPERMHAQLDVLLVGMADSARAAFERASLHDALGEEAAAIPLYREALDGALDHGLRTPAMIQLASSLRNVGDPSGAMAVLQQIDPDDVLADAARAFLALSLYDDGKPAAALRTALQALSSHLPAYERAIDAYAEELTVPERVRVIAVGLLVRDGWVLAEEYPGHDGGGRLLRAPGGGVEFGETAEAAVHREFAEELGVTLDRARLLGVTENLFDRHGKRGHEIVYTYAIRSAELEALPLAARLPVQDADTTVGWYRLDILDAQALPFYPAGVLDLPRGRHTDPL